MVADNQSTTTGNNVTSGKPQLDVKLKPRTATTEQRDEYVEALEDAIVEHKPILAVYRHPAPSKREVDRRFADFSEQDRAELYSEAEAEYKNASAKLYNLVRPTLDISGPYEKSDRAHIRRMFRANDQRLGKELLEWALSFSNETGIDAQLDAQQALLEFNLAPTATLEQIDSHCVQKC